MPITHLQCLVIVYCKSPLTTKKYLFWYIYIFWPQIKWTTAFKITAHDRLGCAQTNNTVTVFPYSPMKCSSCCSSLIRVALSVDANNFTTHGTIFFW
jgi:hypothetical protein